MAQTTRQDERGFIMVALLIAMAIGAIWMTAALPSWRQQVQRGREEDLIFRGEQYARAIVLYQDKNRNLPPPSIDVLVSQHYLRKKWKDPVTNDEFTLVGIGLVSQTSTSPTSPAGVAGGASQGRAGGGAAPINTGGNQSPGITGVRSKSTATSIKVYQQQQQYNLWQFDAATYRQANGRQIAQQGGGRQGQPGQGAPGQGGPGGARGGPGGVGGPGGGRGGDAGTARPVPPPGGATGGRGGRGGI